MIWSLSAILISVFIVPVTSFPHTTTIGISVKGYGTFFHIPAYLLHQTLPRMVRIQISDRLVHTQVHRFFCNISALLPGFLLLNSTHKPAPVPYAPSPSCIQLDATHFLYKKQDVQLDIPATFHPLSALLLMQFSLCHFPVCSRHLLPQFPLHDNLS